MCKGGSSRGNLVRKYREANNLTQYQLAKLVGLTRRGILTLEKGENVPSLRNAIRIAYILGVSVEELFCTDSYLEDLRSGDSHKTKMNLSRYKNGD